MAVGRRRTPQAPRSEVCAVRRALRPAVVVLAALALLAAASGCVEEDAPDAPSPVATAVASASPVLTPTVPTPDVQPGVATGPAEGDSSVPALRVARNDVGTTLEIELVPISAGVAHTCRVEANGAVVCWGSNTYGEAIPPKRKFVSVSAGWIHTCGVQVDGSVSCWGSNHGVDGRQHGQATPPEGEFASVSVGGLHTCGVGLDGTGHPRRLLGREVLTRVERVRRLLGRP